MDTSEDEEGGDDIESSDSDNDDGDLGEFDPELEAKTKQNADHCRVPGACLAYIMSRGRPGDRAARAEPRRLDGAPQ